MLGHEQFKELFNLIYKGNVEATALSFSLLELAHTWDDLYDQDKVVTPEEVSAAFINALFNIPNSPHWGLDMQANLLNVYLCWQDANTIEKDKYSTDDDLAKAWMLRASLYDLFVLLAARMFGLAWAKEIGPIVRKTYGETLVSFIQEVRNA